MSLSKVIKALKNGELVVYPTDTLYGLGADVFNEKAVRAVYEIKDRPAKFPLSITVSSISMMEEFAEMNEPAFILAKKFLPGPLTMVMKKKRIPDIVAEKKIGIRIPRNEIAVKLASDGPITSTSANKHNGKEPTTIDIARNQLGEGILYIDGGKLPGGNSTVVDVTKEIKILRRGIIGEEEIIKVVENYG